MNTEPELEYSQLCNNIDNGGKTVYVNIFRLQGEQGWTLEVVDEYNNSTVWDGVFSDDALAMKEVKKTILKDGIASLIGPVDGKGEWKDPVVDLSKVPRNINQWADEASDALNAAWKKLKTDHPKPNHDEKLKILTYAPQFAIEKREITDQDSINKIYAFVKEKVDQELQHSEKGEPVHYSIIFLMSYLDAHLSIGLLNEKQHDKTMECLMAHYQIPEA